MQVETAVSCVPNCGVHTRSSKLFCIVGRTIILLVEQHLTLSPTLTELTNGRMAEAAPRMEARLIMRMTKLRLRISVVGNGPALPDERRPHNVMNASKTTVNVERRTWDKEAYEARARSRATAAAESEATSNNGSSSSAAASAIRSNLLDADDEPEEFLPAQQGRAGPLGSARAYLKSRSRKVDLEGKLGTTELIDPTAASTIHSKLTTAPTTTVVENHPSIGSGVTKCKDGVGWHCRVCDCFLKDSLTYLDHINGRKHQRYLGYTMRVEQSTTVEVGNVLKGLAESEKMKRQQHHFSGGGLSTEDGGVDYEMVIRNKDEEAQRRKVDRARRREERKRKEKQEKAGNNSRSVAEVIETRMSVAETIQTAEELEEGREVKSGKLDNEYGEEDDDDDPADDNDEYDCGINPMAAMMGFTGFGGSKK